MKRDVERCCLEGWLLTGGGREGGDSDRPNQLFTLENGIH